MANRNNDFKHSPRRQFLLIASLYAALNGFSWLLTSSASREQALTVMPDLFGSAFIGGLMVFTAVVTLVAVFRHKRWGKEIEALAFGALLGTCAYIGVVFLGSTVVAILTNGELGSLTGWVSALSYLLVAGFFSIVSRWEEKK